MVGVPPGGHAWYHDAFEAQGNSQRAGVGVPPGGYAWYYPAVRGRLLPGTNERLSQPSWQRVSWRHF